MEQPLQKTNPFTCISCSVAFKDAEMQRNHYKSDWHRYNLKRKVSDLPPVTAENFHQKVLNQRNMEQLAQQDKSVYCQICRKSFGNENAYNNHLNSKKHKENEKTFQDSDRDSESRVDEELEVEEVDSDEWDEESENPIDANDCIFCVHHSKNFIKNLEHMTTSHSFFIPDIEYCTDVYGLLKYLAEKVSEGFMCLWCNEKGKTFYTAEAARQHMLDKGHCKMLHEGEALAEYADFYDYSSSYPDADKEHDPNEEVALPELDGSDYQLVLPSGTTVGHRSLMRYYKQNPNPNSALVVKDSKKMGRLLSSYRALGWVETSKEAAARKARDIHYLKRVEGKLRLMLGVKGNKLQKNVQRLKT